ncbi:MAG TPA: hypothetical protein VKJ07_07455, partial [Mycobacteriales bacterium]|nr:hypothetical protein [Mycobacteriales bacterium]
MKPQLDPTHLAVVRCPAGWQAPPAPPGVFLGVVSTPDEVIVVAPEQLFENAAWGSDVEQMDDGRRRVTFPGPLPWELVGFLAD